jgi:hypothetical protein
MSIQYKAISCIGVPLAHPSHQTFALRYSCLCMKYVQLYHSFDIYSVSYGIYANIIQVIALQNSFCQTVPNFEE